MVGRNFFKKFLVEINIKIAMEGYRKSVEKIEALLTSAKKH